MLVLIVSDNAHSFPHIGKFETELALYEDKRFLILSVDDFHSVPPSVRREYQDKTPLSFSLAHLDDIDVKKMNYT